MIRSPPECSSNSPSALSIGQQFPKQSILKKTSKYTTASTTNRKCLSFINDNEIEKELEDLNKLGSCNKQLSPMNNLDKSRAKVDSKLIDAALQYELDCLERVLSTRYGSTMSPTTTDGSSYNMQSYSSNTSPTFGSISSHGTPIQYHHRDLVSDYITEPNIFNSKSKYNINPIVDNRAPLPFAFDNLSTGGIKGNIATVGAVEPEKPYPPFAKSYRKQPYVGY